MWFAFNWNIFIIVLEFFLITNLKNQQTEDVNFNPIKSALSYLKQLRKKIFIVLQKLDSKIVKLSSIHGIILVQGTTILVANLILNANDWFSWTIFALFGVYVICSSLSNILVKISIILQPILPKFSSDIFKQLNIKPQMWRDLDFSLKNHKIRKAEPLIKKTEVKQKEVLPFQLRVGKILEVKDHPEAEKLYLLQVDLGKLGKRQLVAGLRPFYKTAELKGKKIIVVTNLKPAKLRGALSEGMLLAAESKDGKTVEVLEPSKARLGDRVVFGDYGEGSDKIDIQTFMKTKITVGLKGEILAKGAKMHSDSEEIKANKVKNGKVR